MNVFVFNLDVKASLVIVCVAQFVMIAKFVSSDSTDVEPSSERSGNATNTEAADVSPQIAPLLQETLLEMVVCGVHPSDGNFAPNFGLPRNSSVDGGLTQEIYNDSQSSISSCMRLNASVLAQNDTNYDTRDSVARHTLADIANIVGQFSENTLQKSKEPKMRRAAKSLFSKQTNKLSPLVLTPISLSSYASRSARPFEELRGILHRACIVYPVKCIRRSQREHAAMSTRTQLLISRQEDLKSYSHLHTAIIESYVDLLTQLETLHNSTSDGKNNSKHRSVSNTIADSNLWTTNSDVSGSRDVSLRFSIDFNDEKDRRADVHINPGVQTWFISRGRTIRNLHTGESMHVLVCAHESVPRELFENAFQCGSV